METPKLFFSLNLTPPYNLETSQYFSELNDFHLELEVFFENKTLTWDLVFIGVKALKITKDSAVDAFSISNLADAVFEIFDSEWKKEIDSKIQTHKVFGGSTHHFSIYVPESGLYEFIANNVALNKDK